MKLERKYLTPYLPFDVLVKYKDLHDKNRVAVLTGVSKTEIETTYKRRINGCVGDIISWNGRNNVEDLKVKPCLRPLSDLTNEIEHNGERFVPMAEIIKAISLFDLSECGFEFEPYEEKDGCYVNAVLNGRVVDSITFDGNMFRCMNNDGGFDFYNPQHEALDFLNKYHFDWKYNLIPAGLALNINDL